jgi:DNA-binding response OmpR family regulator
MSAERPSVLIVEDERELADLYGEWLEMAGCSVRTAYDGRTALEHLDPEVDVALLDRRLPEMRGEQILERIRDSEQDCSVAMVTAVEPEADIIEMGFDEYLVKPVKQAELMELVNELSTDLPPGLEDPVLDALGDRKARRCLYALQESPKSASELVEATGLARTTVYRRLNALRKADLISSRTTIDPDGDHYETFVADTELVLVELEEGFRVETDPDET